MVSHRFLAIATFFIWAAVLLPAAESGFLSALTSTQRSAAGLDRLSTSEQAVLNTLVAREVSFARQGNVRGFAGTFVSRRHGTEAHDAGLDQLSADEQAKLDDYVSAALAAGPVKPEPKELKPGDVTGEHRLQVHGEVSLTYGWGGGRSFRAGSLYTDIYDPETGVRVGIGLGEVSGDARLIYGPGGFYGYDSYYPGSAGYLYNADQSNWANALIHGGSLRSGAFNGSGSCFRTH